MVNRNFKKVRIKGRIRKALGIDIQWDMEDKQLNFWKKNSQKGKIILQ